MDTDLSVRLPAVREALSLAGVATVATAADGSQRVVVPAVEPAASAVLALVESFQLARDVVGPGTPWAAYADSLYAMGWLGSDYPPEIAASSLWGQLVAFASYAKYLKGDEPSAVAWLLIGELTRARGDCED